MFDYISGTVEHLGEDHVVLDVGGVGFRIHTSVNTISKLRLGSEVRIYTQLLVKEDDLSLVGFSTREELTMFKRLTAVSGVGPKAALAVLAIGSIRDIASAIISNDYKRLMAAQGVGKKTAERIILELKDRMKTEDLLVQGEEPISVAGGLEAVEALVALGYDYHEAAKAVGALPDQNKKTELLIKEALRVLSRK